MQYLHAAEPELLKSILKEGKLTDELEAQLSEVNDTFLQQHPEWQIAAEE